MFKDKKLIQLLQVQQEFSINSQKQNLTKL